MLSLLLAQSTPSNGLPSWDAISNYTALSFTLWYCWYVTSVSGPKKDADHAATIKQINTDNNELTDKIVVNFRDEMKLAREQHVAAMTAQRDECKREVEWLMAAFQARNTPTI